MHRVEKVQEHSLDQIVSNFKREQFQYHEYKFIDTNQLSAFLISKCKKRLENEDNLTLAYYEGSSVLGMLCCIKDHFDSEIFGFACYRVVDMLVFSFQVSDVRRISKELLIALESELVIRSKPFYLAVSLSNNIPNMDFLFNSLTANHYHYIHTLITFFSEKRRFEASAYYPKENIKIRHALFDDAEAIADLAYKSFKYSRFHLDPFLDHNKASDLLRVSALNSILQGFVDVMYVAEIDNRIVGYYSAKKHFIPEFEMTFGEAVISAVDKSFRGIGIFSKMDAHLLNWFADNTDYAEMGTYLSNSPIHSTWISKGLRLIRATHQFSKYINA
jgi:hypothetical protein